MHRLLGSEFNTLQQQLATKTGITGVATRWLAQMAKKFRNTVPRAYATKTQEQNLQNGGVRPALTNGTKCLEM